MIYCDLFPSIMYETIYTCLVNISNDLNTFKNIFCFAYDFIHMFLFIFLWALFKLHTAV